MFDWKSSLEQLFSATVNQEPLEEAAYLMVSVSARDPSYHAECLAILKGAIQACDIGDMSVISAVNTSGYQVGSSAEAKELLVEFLDVYEQKYEEAVG